MIYKTLKLIVKIALRVFYREIVVQNKSDLPGSGPMIIVVNHPNTFMDPLIVAALFKQKVGFLANASVFVNEIVNSIFGYFNVIPVYRQKDVAKGEQTDNTKTFNECSKYLEDGNALMIFPEGSSYHELRLRKIKTGAARIALGTEEKNKFKLGIKILPVGLYYSDPSRFRSKIYVNIDDAIEVVDFQSDYKQDSVSAVQKLTAEIKLKLEENIIITEDEEQEELFVNVKRIYKSRLLEKSGKADSPNEEFRLTRELAKAIQYFQVNNEETFRRIKNNVEKYIQMLDESRLAPGANKSTKRKTHKILYAFLGLLYLVVGFPVYFFGAIQNFIPYKVPYWTAKKITSEIEYHAPIMLSVGIFVFPIVYFIFGYCFYGFVSRDALVFSLYLILLPLSGFYCLHYSVFFEKVRSFITLNPIFKKQDKKIAELQSLKTDIISMLDEARETYLKRL